MWGNTGTYATWGIVEDTEWVDPLLALVGPQYKCADEEKDLQILGGGRGGLQIEFRVADSQ